MGDGQETVGDNVPDCRSPDVVSGDGWALLSTRHCAAQPGVHDVGARLGVTRATMLLVVLRAAESWALEDSGIAVPPAIICREGVVLVEFDDGSVRRLDRDSLWIAAERPLRRVTNATTSLAQVLMFAPRAR